jgi:hypothetical protein
MEDFWRWCCRERETCRFLDFEEGCGVRKVTQDNSPRSTQRAQNGEGRLGRQELAPFFVFDQEAGVLDNGDAGGAGFFGGCGVFYAQLEPQDFGFDGDGRVGDGRHIFGAAEDVDDVDGFGDVFESRVGFFAQDFRFVGVDGGDAIADGFEIGSDFVAGAGWIGGEADDCDGFGGAEKVEDGIGGGFGAIGKMDVHREWMNALKDWLWLGLLSRTGQSFGFEEAYDHARIPPLHGRRAQVRRGGNRPCRLG